MRTWILLIIAIMFETCATSLLGLSDGFKKPFASGGAVVAYIASFYLLSLALRDIKLGVAYAVWSGLGIILVTISGAIFLKQKIHVWDYFGMFLILVGMSICYLYGSGSNDGK